ncbi:Thyrotropin-releasing hormone receptor [Holothuria leucospilota]|uniref:Thyrotropin-releasing hormone receptor n=1 Tax=Holothuria leucospilota TaxID=206669 RepID=A0A9Q1BKE7_HOLLE|nr:Thyrotropin-releasing hormone receptor [Holothuria leucospilota]
MDFSVYESNFDRFLQGPSLYGENQGCSYDVSYDFRNYTDEEIEEFHPPPHKIIIYLYVLPVVLSLGVFSNSAFIFVIIRLKRMRTITNFYLVNLAIADISYLLIGTTEKLVRTLSSPIDTDQGMFSRWSCIVIYSLLDTTSFASLFLVSLVTLEKFYAVCFPLKHRRVTGQGRTVKLVIFCWVLACAFACSLMPSYWLIIYACTTWPDRERYSDYPSRIGACWPVSDFAMNSAYGMQTIPFFLALLPNTVMYIKIVGTLNSRVATSSEMNSSREQNLRMRNMVARMLVANGTLFFALASPFHILSFIIMIISLSSPKLDHLYDGIDTAIPVCQLLLYMNSAVNPVVYSVTNSRYRKAYLDAVKSLRRKRTKHNGNSSLPVNNLSHSDPT